MTLLHSCAGPVAESTEAMGLSIKLLTCCRYFFRHYQQQIVASDNPLANLLQTRPKTSQCTVCRVVSHPRVYRAPIQARRVMVATASQASNLTYKCSVDSHRDPHLLWRLVLSVFAQMCHFSLTRHLVKSCLIADQTAAQPFLTRNSLSTPSRQSY